MERKNKEKQPKFASVSVVCLTVCQSSQFHTRNVCETFNRKVSQNIDESRLMTFSLEKSRKSSGMRTQFLVISTTNRANKPDQNASVSTQ